MANQAYKKQRQKLHEAITAKKKAELIESINKHPDGILHGITSLITKDRKQAMGNSNVEYRATSIVGLVGSKIVDALDDLRTKYGGLYQDKELAADVVHSIFGKDVANPKAKAYAKLWSEAAEDLRLQFNAAGGDIGKLDNWGLPQSHNMFKIGKAGKDEWIACTQDKIDLAKMDIGDTANINEFLDYVYDTITTGGLNSFEPGKIPRGVSSARANAHREHRVLIFKDSDSWLEYQKKFGQDDTYNAMTDHIRGMANDIALLEIFGPNPDNMFDYLLQVAKKEGQLSAIKEGHIRAMYNVASGRVDGSKSVTKGDMALEAGLGTLRSTLVAAKLGTAVFSAVSDVASIIHTARYNDMPVFKTIFESIKLFTPSERKNTAARMGIVMDGWEGTVSSRFSEIGYGNMEKVSSFLMRASGINAWTDGFRKGFSTELMGHLADQTKKGFGELSDHLKDEFTKRGISPEDWDIIRGSELLEHNGATFMSAERILNNPNVDKGRARELAIKVLEYMNTETDYAVLVPDARVRAITTFGAERGTLKGEAARTMMMFKSFPIAMLTTHISRGLNQKTFGNKVAYTAQFLLMSTAFGAIALQLKNIAVGKDPKPMDEGKFWAAAFAQSGGLGIFGDFLFQDHTRYGNSIWATFGGPAVGLGEDVIKLSVGNFQKAFDEKQETALGADLFNFMYNYAPGQSLWYTRLALERELKDQVNSMLDKNWRKKRAKKIRKLKKEEHQAYWWQPGDVGPRRSPDLINIGGK